MSFSSFFSEGPVRDALVSDVLAFALVFVFSGALFVARKNELWRAALEGLWRKQKLALFVLTLFSLVAFVDAVEWVGGASSGADTVAAHEARSLLDRTLGSMREKSYSAPFAGRLLETGATLKFPGRHVLGTNVLGEDVLYLTLKGARVALLVGTLTSLIAIPLALFFGMTAGYFGGRTDDIVFFTMSTLASLPGILLLVTLIMVLGKSTVSVCVALGVTSWVSFCRLARGETMKLRELDYVAAAKTLGVSNTKILLRHILPNLGHLVVITFVLMFSGLVLSETTLAWLGIGVDGSWGQMIAQAKDELSRDPVIYWNFSAAGFALFSLLLSVNLVGDALRDVLDPRSGGRR